MGEDIVTQSVLLFWGGILGGLVLGGLLGWIAGFGWGLGVGCLLIGLGGLAGAAHLGWHRWQAIEGSVATTGVMMGIETETTRGADGRAITLRLPVVRFVTPDGAEHRVKGLGGSQADAAPGDAIPVRYRPEDPSQALVADAQNLWGGVWGLGVFGVVPLLVGVASVAGTRAPEGRTPGKAVRVIAPNRGRRPVHAARAGAKGARRPADARTRLPGRRQQAVTWGTRGGHLLLLSSLITAGLFADDVGRAVATCFSMVAGAFLLYGVASAARDGSWHAGVTSGIAGLTFLLFASGLWLFS